MVDHNASFERLIVDTLVATNYPTVDAVKYNLLKSKWLKSHTFIVCSRRDKKRGKKIKVKIVIVCPKAKPTNLLYPLPCLCPVLTHKHIPRSNAR